MNSFIKNISDNVPVQQNEYVDKEGLLRCSVCHERTQRRNVCEELGIDTIVRCICSCGRKKLEKLKDQEREEALERQRNICFASTNMGSWDFSNDDSQFSKLSKAMQRYALDFEKYKKDGMGLLLIGPVGVGKTYYAACIANALIDKGYKVKMTNFATIVNELWGCDNKSEYMRCLNSYSLLILDDLGIERSTDYMKEMVYNIVDGRYRSGLPMIITTNLSWEQLTKTTDIGYKRIFDRVLEKCHPVKVDGQNRRRQNVISTIPKMNENLGLK